MSTAAAHITAGRRGQGLIVSSWEIAKRVLRKFLRSPQLVLLGTIQGSSFLLIFRYVFGGAITTQGVSYVNFLVPGFVTTSVLFVGFMAATGIAEDMQDGFMSRLRSLPIPRSAVLLGRALADTGIQVWSLGIMVVLSFLIGFSLQASAAAAIEAVLLILVYAFAFEWVFLAAGMFAGSPQAAQGFALLIFPLTFVSSAYIPVATMPSWMQGFAENQPVTVMVNAIRALTEGRGADVLLGHDAAYFVIRSLVWSGAIILVMGPLAVWKYRRS